MIKQILGFLSACYTVLFFLQISVSWLGHGRKKSVGGTKKVAFKDPPKGEEVVVVVD